jgi:uncharacterized protein YecE (DUF72 family)
MDSGASIRLGTSAFTAAGWEGSFYPGNLKPADYLTYYSQHFDTVEVDSTFYRSPAPAIVRGWYAKTPAGFLFAAKVPQAITHEKILLHCDAQLKDFLSSMDNLHEKLGPLLFQFPYFNKTVFKSGKEFLGRLKPFLNNLPRGYDFAVEIRNKNWLSAELFDLLREHKVAFALIDQAWMPRPSAIFHKFDPITARFTYVRWLGDRKGIEEQTKIWDKAIVDRQVEIAEWVLILKLVVARGIKAFAYANNHYAGHAPATVKLFWDLWKNKR